MKNIIIKGYKNLNLNCYLYLPSTKPKAVIQIIHGMQEHALRYNDFATFLAQNSYIVLTSDLRGHGKTAISIDKLGYNDGDIFSDTIEDQKIICNYLKNKYKLPIYIFGHSYGSFITQKFIQVCNIPNKFIICGTTNGSSILIKLGALTANIIYGLGFKNKKAKLIENLTLNAYAKKFNKGNWLTRDYDIFEKFQQDKYCGGSFPVSFYKSMFSNLTKINKSIKNINNNIKIFFIAGDKDPVSSNGKQVINLYKLYVKKGKNAKLTIYKNCRHELINELNKEEIYSDILNFYNN